MLNLSGKLKMLCGFLPLLIRNSKGNEWTDGKIINTNEPCKARMCIFGAGLA